jgi:methylated-DNA-protein-cysteine methyltransferase-like protein
MRRCPEGIPWQRVINAQGRISARPGQGPEIQLALLEEEGVAFDTGGQVDLAVYGWPQEDDPGDSPASGPG